MEKVANTRIRLLSLVRHMHESNKMDHRKTGCWNMCRIALADNVVHM